MGDRLNRAPRLVSRAQWGEQGEKRMGWEPGLRVRMGWEPGLRVWMGWKPGLRVSHVTRTRGGWQASMGTAGEMVSQHACAGDMARVYRSSARGTRGCKVDITLIPTLILTLKLT